jgi:hypothetical protein
MDRVELQYLVMDSYIDMGHGIYTTFAARYKLGMAAGK